MRKRVIVLAVAVVAAALSWVVVSPQSQAQPAPSVCDGTYWGGTFGSLTVPSGAECVLINSRVRGSITANPDTSLRTCGTAITGNVSSTQGYVNMDYYSTVGGTITLNEPGTEMYELIPCGGPIGVEDGFAAYLCPRSVGGSINVTNGPDSYQVVDLADCGYMNVHGSVHITGNDLLVEAFGMNIVGSLYCLNNDPTADIQYTHVGGSVHGQCYGGGIG